MRTCSERAVQLLAIIGKKLGAAALASSQSSLDYSQESALNASSASGNLRKLRSFSTTILLQLCLRQMYPAISRVG